MPVVMKKSVLSGTLVKEAMRRQVVKLPKTASLSKCINHLVKYKSHSVLVTDEVDRPMGIASKTDIIGAYYGGFPVESPVRSIMNGPLITCFPDDELEAALDLMRTHGVHQLFVQGADRASVVGVLTYPDVVALIYRCCRSCPRNTNRRRPGSSEDPEAVQLWTVHEAMTGLALGYHEEDSLADVIEGMVAYRLGGVLIRDAGRLARGVISKTDLIVAYNHGRSLDATAGHIMKSPVETFDERSLLGEAIRAMFMKDVQRLFIHAGDPMKIVGVLSLTDAARIRSASCRACMPSRIIPIV
jgi:CBS domain-containing protein